ncbi:hypothetical protein [Bradyrhizobium sp. I1.7.5]|uniref:hypothetical protein n=1 Tax=Bradyrhizobium sp. I1.7.5 TaxID=3156363 RepID=UPI003393D0E3
MMNRGSVKRGQFMRGGDYPAEFVEPVNHAPPRAPRARPRLQKGSFLTVDAPVRRQQLPPEYAEFQQAADLADRLAMQERLEQSRQRHVSSMGEIVQRLKRMQADLAAITKAKRK